MGTESVINQADIVLIAAHRLQTRLVILNPLQPYAAALELGEKLLGQDVIVLVIFNEQDLEWVDWRGGFHDSRRSRLLGRQFDNLEPVTAQYLHHVYQ